MKVTQFYHNNQFVIERHEKAHTIYYLQSYNSIVAKVDIHITKGTKITLGKYWDYSNTTRKHLYLFLEEFACYYIPYDCNNKRAFLQKEIDNKKIGYDEKLD